MKKILTLAMAGLFCFSLSLHSMIPGRVADAASNSVISVVPDTVPVIIPDTVPSVVPDTVPSIVPDTAPSVAPDTVPAIAPDTVPSVVPDTVPVIVPDTLLPVGQDAFPSRLYLIGDVRTAEGGEIGWQTHFGAVLHARGTGIYAISIQGAGHFAITNALTDEPNDWETLNQYYRYGTISSSTGLPIDGAWIIGKTLPVTIAGTPDVAGSYYVPEGIYEVVVSLVDQTITVYGESPVNTTAFNIVGATSDHTATANWCNGQAWGEFSGPTFTYNYENGVESYVLLQEKVPAGAYWFKLVDAELGWANNIGGIEEKVWDTAYEMLYIPVMSDGKNIGLLVDYEMDIIITYYPATQIITVSGAATEDPSGIEQLRDTRQQRDLMYDLLGRPVKEPRGIVIRADRSR